MTQEKRGPGSMDENKQRSATNKPGQSGSGNVKDNPQRAAQAGDKSGHQDSSNLAHDRDRASNPGRKDGQS
jgi:hypothetical protein